MKNGEYKPIDTGFTSNSFITLSTSGDVYTCSGSPTKFSCVAHILPSGGEVRN